MSIMDCLNFFLSFAYSLLLDIECYLKMVLKYKEIIGLTLIIGSAIWRCITFFYKYFTRRKCDSFCEMVRNDLDNQDTVLTSVLIDRKILKRMYPKMRMKYIDLCLEKMKKEGDTFTDQYGQDRYKRRI